MDDLSPEEILEMGAELGRWRPRMEQFAEQSNAKLADLKDEFNVAAVMLFLRLHAGTITQDDAIAQMRPLKSAIRAAGEGGRRGMAKLEEDRKAFMRRVAASIGIELGDYYTGTDPEGGASRE